MFKFRKFILFSIAECQEELMDKEVQSGLLCSSETETWTKETPVLRTNLNPSTILRDPLQ